MSYSLYLKGSDKKVGAITKDQLQTLIDLFEEEDTKDQDYFVDANTIQFLKDKNADEALVELLAANMGDEGAEFEWREDAD